MKTNISIELNDEQRNKLKILIDGKASKKMISRKEVIALCEQHIGGLLGTADPISGGVENVSIRSLQKKVDLYDIDPEDRALMAQPENPSYVRGWNLVKRSKRTS